MNVRRLVRLSGVLAQLALPGTLVAQAAGGLEFFGSFSSSEPVSRTMGGVGLSVVTPILGLRGSGGLGTSSWGPAGAGSPSDLAWAMDADLLIGSLNTGRGPGLLPYSFAGIGMMSSAEPSGFTSAVQTWSYGGGVQVALGRTLALTGEARSRHLTSPATYADSVMVGGLEYRFGIGFSFGGPARRGGYSRGRASGSPPRAPRPRTSGRSTSWPVSNAGSGAARRVVPEGERYIGVPYKWGGSSPRSGFDCSGFVQYVYGSQGVDLPRTSRQMAGAGVGVSASRTSLTVGDLLLFAQNGTINHVAIYAGGGRILHSSSSGGGVRYDDLDSGRGRWFADRMVAVRRVSGDNRAVANALAAAAKIPFDTFDNPDSAPPPNR